MRAWTLTTITAFAAMIIIITPAITDRGAFSFLSLLGVAGNPGDALRSGAQSRAQELPLQRAREPGHAVLDLLLGERDEAEH